MPILYHQKDLPMNYLEPISSAFSVNLYHFFYYYNSLCMLSLNHSFCILYRHICYFTKFHLTIFYQCLQLNPVFFLEIIKLCSYLIYWSSTFNYIIPIYLFGYTRINNRTTKYLLGTITRFSIIKGLS